MMMTMMNQFKQRSELFEEWPNIYTKVKEGRKEMFFLTTHSTHFIYGYMASDMVKNHSDSERGNPLPPHRILLAARVL